MKITAKIYKVRVSTLKLLVKYITFSKWEAPLIYLKNISSATAPGKKLYKKKLFFNKINLFFTTPKKFKSLINKDITSLLNIEEYIAKTLKNV